MKENHKSRSINWKFHIVWLWKYREVINNSVYYQEAAEGHVLKSYCSSNNSLSFHHPTIKAYLHIRCCAHAVPLPCCATKGSECVFPIWFTQCGCVWFTLAMPCPYHAPTMPFFSSPRHSMAAEGRLVGCQRSASSSGYHSEFHKVVIRCIPDSDAGGQFETKHRLSWMRKRVVAAHYKKDSLLHCGLAVWIFLATMRTFTKDAALSEQGMGAAWQGNGMARHGNSMLCVNRPLLYAHPGKVTLKMYTNLQENLITGMWVTLWQIFVLHNRCLACWPIAKLV